MAASLDTVPLAELQAIVGSAHARPAAPADAVDDRVPAAVVEPGSVAEVHEVVRLAHRLGLSLTPRGSGTKLGWGSPPAALHLVVRLTRLNRLIEHAAGDLVVKAEAGLRLDALQAHLAAANQMLALDPPHEGATLGGIVAANASGPRRLRYGTVRDLLIGITVVLADGTVAKAGGKVVKNVAGYDLGKLFTGSLGTLGLIVDATFRLHPRPVARRLVQVDLESPARLGDAVKALVQSALVPSAMELAWPGVGRAGTLCVLFEAVAPAVASQADAALLVAGRHGPAVSIEDEQFASRWADAVRLPFEPGGVGVKLSAPPGDLAFLVDVALETSGTAGARVRLSGSAGNGIVFAGLTGATDAILATVSGIRAAIGPRGGHLVVIEAPASLKRQLDVWGPGGDALALMRRVKAQFDPTGILSPGRFVGNI